MIMLNIWKNIATLGPIGYFKGSGTIASAFAIILVILLHSLHLSFCNVTILIFFLTLCILKLVDVVMPLFDYQDSPYIVIDEVLGMVYTFWGISLNVKIVLLGFVLFRFFDITKVLGIGYLEKKIPNPWSIVLDDIFAGLLANCLLRLIILSECF